MEVKLLIHTALLDEARIFIDNYKLKKLLEIKSFNFYYSKTEKILIIISGLGASNTSLAIGYAAGYFEFTNSCVFFNCGMAGHKYYNPGQLCYIYAATNAHDHKKIHLTFTLNPRIQHEEITTYQAGVETYPNRGLADLESYYFIQAAQRFQSKEFIFITKIISDNESTPFNKTNTLELFHKQSSILTQQVQQLLQHQQRYHSQHTTTNINILLENYRFSKTETIKVTNYLQSLNNLDYDVLQLLTRTTNKRDFIRDLEITYFNQTLNY